MDYVFNFLVDDVDEVQSDIDLVNAFSDTAAEQLKVAIDADVLQNVYSSASPDNIGTTAGVTTGAFNFGESGTPVTITKENVLDYIVDVNTVLTEQNVPESERWQVYPPIITGLIKKGDLKDCSLTGDKTSVLRNGVIGMIDNTKILMSNQLYGDNTNGFYCLCGHPIAISFASQLSKTRSIEAQNTFGTYISGLEVYGYDVTKAVALSYILAVKG